MLRCFEIADGSIPGRNHVGGGGLLAGRNNQDACCWRREEGMIVAVVCDGCSSGRHSECGAQIGARLVAESVARHVPSRIPEGESIDPARLADGLEGARQQMLSQILALAMQIGDRREPAIHDYFLFTVVGALILPRWTLMFSMGDGVFVLNGGMTRLGPFDGNAPPYPAYALLLPRNGDDGDDPLRFRIERMVPTAQIQSLLIGTDGVVDLVAAEDRLLPGRREPVGPIARFWEEDRYFANRDAIRRRLALINSESVKLDADMGRLVRTPGLLPDDTTLVVIRRKPGI